MVDLQKLSMKQALKAYDLILTPLIGTDQYYPMVAELAKQDRFFLLTHLLKRPDAIHPWLYARCRELETNPDGYLDLWARFSFKSTLGTFAGIIQEIIRDPEITICILSFNNSTASAFLLQIKNEFEKNDDLKAAFPDIFYDEPKRDAPTWSLDKGIVIKRKTNPKEATVEAYGLVDNQPVGRHYMLRVYDDVVTMASVTTPDMIFKTTEAWELSQSLGAGRRGTRMWHFGTRYNAADSYQHLLDRGALVPRIYPATDDGTPTGKLVFMSQEEWDELVKNTSDYVLACLRGDQRIMLRDWAQKPISDIEVGDELVGVWPGFGPGSGRDKDGRPARVHLGVTEVVAKGSRLADVYEFVFESGKKIYATIDHKWWSGRPLRTYKKDHHRVYAPLELKSNRLHRVIRIVDPDSGSNASADHRLAAAWLGGFFDGEGSTNRKKSGRFPGDTFADGTISFTQSMSHNPHVCHKLLSVLDLLGFDYSVYNYEKRAKEWKHNRSALQIRLKGGRREVFRFLNLTAGFLAKRSELAKMCYGGRLGYKVKKTTTSSSRDQLKEINFVGLDRVYSITTTSGNYIAEGCVSKNCQQLLDPLSGKQREFSPDWVRRWEVRPRYLNVYILCDPAGGKKTVGCNTAMVVIGLDAQGNKYLLDGACHQMDLDERWRMLKHLFFKWKVAVGVQAVTVVYERYSMQADIPHFEIMMQHEKKFFPIQDVGGGMKKEDRVRRLIPDFKNWSFFLPEVDKFTRDMKEALDSGRGDLVARPIKRKDRDGNVYELTQWFLDHEYNLFPHNRHKDTLDAMSRLYDVELIPPMKMDNVQLAQETEFDTFGGPCYYEGICLEPDIYELH